MATAVMPHAELLQPRSPLPWRRWLGLAALTATVIVLLAVIAAAILLARQRAILHQLPLPQVPPGYTAAPPTVPGAWTRWSTTSWAAQGPTEAEIYPQARGWLRGAAGEPPAAAAFIKTDALRRQDLLEALRTPLLWSSLAVSGDGWPVSQSVFQQTIGGLLMLRVAAESLQLASAADPAPATELHGLDNLAQAMWPPADAVCLTCIWTVAASRDQAYLLAVAQGRLGPAEASSWLREPARNVTALIDAEQVDLQYWEPLAARWAVKSGPLAYHARWMGTPSWPVDLWDWLQVPSTTRHAIAVDHDLVQRLEGAGPSFPCFDLSAFRGGPLRDTDMPAYLAERAVIADAQHRALRMAAAVLLHRRTHGALPASLDQAGILDVGSQPARPVDLPLSYHTLSDSMFEIRVPADHRAPEFITPRCLMGEPVASTARAPIQELRCGLRVDSAALGR